MYEDSNRNKINVIGAYLILNHDINDEKAAKLMTITKSGIDKNRNLPHLTLIFLEFTPTSFGKESNKAVLSITEHHWMSKAIYDKEISSK